MPSLKDIKRRIGSVKSTQQITRAMKLVAAAKLKRATDTALAARPYAESLDDMLDRLAAEEVTHPLMDVREKPRKIALVVVTSDRGLCGGFNSSLLRQTEKWLATREEEVEIYAFGRKARDHFARRPEHNVVRAVVARDPADALDEARSLAPDLAERFQIAEVDAVYLAYNRFVSVMSQQPNFIPLVPISPTTLDEVNVGLLQGKEGEGSLLSSTSFVFEPDRESILAALLPLYLETRVYQVFLDSVAGEFAARMRAMDAATRNAGELISKLTLQYNRARQAAITTELMEIISGAEALK